jgi:hypothetical protein
LIAVSTEADFWSFMQAVAACAEAALEASGCGRAGSLGAGCAAACGGADCGACDGAAGGAVRTNGTGWDVVMFPGVVCRGGFDCELGPDR